MIGIAEIDAAIARMGEIAKADPAMLGMFRSKLASAGIIDTPIRQADKGPPPPFPNVTDITAIQTAVFDNWPGGRQIKNQPNRYGMAVEVWTKPAEKIRVTNKKPNYDFKSQCALMDGDKLTAFIKVLRKPRKAPLPTDYLELLEGLAGQIGKHTLVGLINTNIKDDHQPYERGTYYHPYQFVIVGVRDGEITNARLALRKDTIELPAFDTSDAGGNPHGGNVILQSRFDLCGFSKSWGTSEG